MNKRILQTDCFLEAVAYLVQEIIRYDYYFKHYAIICEDDPNDLKFIYFKLLLRTLKARKSLFDSFGFENLKRIIVLGRNRDDVTKVFFLKTEDLELLRGVSLNGCLIDGSNLKTNDGKSFELMASLSKKNGFAVIVGEDKAKLISKKTKPAKIEFEDFLIRDVFYDD